MKWETKVKLAEALNNGDNKEVCEIIQNNEMDMQAWDMFVCGMDLRQFEDYRCISDKIDSIKHEYIKHAGIAESMRFGMLVLKLGLNLEG